MQMDALRDRTKEFAKRVVRMFVALPREEPHRTLGKQVLRSGTSVAANFREPTRARCTAEFLSKLGIVEQELDETIFWLELLVEEKLIATERMGPLLDEANQLLGIVITCAKTTKNRLPTSDLRP
jgi:four helix bundle protein